MYKMNTHRYFTQNWKPIKEFGFRDCRTPLRLPRDDNTKIIIKSSHMPKSFVERTEFERSIIMERFMEKLQMLIDNNEVIKGFRQQEFLQDIEEQAYSKELSDKLKVLNDNIMRYKIPKEQADKLRDELLKEILLNKQASQTRNIPMNSLGQPINQLGAVSSSQSPAPQFSSDDVDDEITDAIGQASRITGVNLPEDIRARVQGEAVRLNTPQTSFKKWGEKLKSPLRLIQQPSDAVLMKRTLLFARWKPLEGLFSLPKSRPTETQLEDITTYPPEQLETMWNLLMNMDIQVMNEVFRPLVGNVNAERNAELDVLLKYITNPENAMVEDTTRRGLDFGGMTPAEAPQS